MALDTIADEIDYTGRSLIGIHPFLGETCCSPVDPIRTLP